MAPVWPLVEGRRVRVRVRGCMNRTESGRPNNPFTNTCISPPWLVVNCCLTSCNPISCSFAYPSLADENLKTGASLQLVDPFLHTAAWVALGMKSWVDVWFTCMEGIRVLKFVCTDVATLSLLQPSNWMGGETVGCLLTSTVLEIQFCLLWLTRLCEAGLLCLLRP